MDNLKVNQDKIIMILINEIIDLKAELKITSSALNALIKHLQPESATAFLQVLQEQRAEQVQLSANEILGKLGTESLEMEHYLKALIRQ